MPKKYYIDDAIASLDKHLYYQAIWYANVSYRIYSDLPGYEAKLSALIGRALYYLGNYSDSQIYFKTALQHLNIHLQNEIEYK